STRHQVLSSTSPSDGLSARFHEYGDTGGGTGRTLPSASPPRMPPGAKPRSRGGAPGPGLGGPRGSGSAGRPTGSGSPRPGGGGRPHSPIYRRPGARWERGGRGRKRGGSDSRGEKGGGRGA